MFANREAILLPGVGILSCDYDPFAIPLHEHLHHYAISGLLGGAVRIFVAALARCACGREVASSCGGLPAFSCVWRCGSRLGSTRTPR
jgi:hypothetical protein